MPDRERQPDDVEPDEHVRQRRARRRRSVDSIFGEVLPSTTSDESGPGDPDRPRSRGAGDKRDEEIRRDVPPHHR